MKNKALGKHIQAVMPTDASRIHTHTIVERLYQQRGVTATEREVKKELDLMLTAGLVIYDHINTPRWATRMKRDPLPGGIYDSAEMAYFHLGKAYDAWEDLGRHINHDPEEPQGYAYREVQRHLANAQAEVLGLRQGLAP